MPSDSRELWAEIERSLTCAAEAKRLSAHARSLRERSEKLRQESIVLSAQNRTFHSINQVKIER